MKTCKLIYSFQFPESRELLNKIWKDEPHFLFDDNYLKAQENKEKEFIELWKQWSKDVIIHNSELSKFYPTNGSSEAIREIIYQLKNRNRRLIIFKYDYEGYKAFASACDLEFVEVDKEQIFNFKFSPNDTMVFSHPASYDGNLWTKYDELMKKLEKEKIQVYVDLCYVGTIAKNYTINLSYSNIEGIFMSLSKVFGVYYQRIGGLLSRKEEPGLFGNQWFKNMFSLHFGIELMNKYPVKFLPNKYKDMQAKICEDISVELSDNIIPSDVVFLAYSPSLVKDYERGNGSRFCLTPGMDSLSGGPYNKVKKDQA